MRVLIIIFVTLFCFLVSSASSQASGNFGALAYSMVTKRSAAATNHQSEIEARKAALHECGYGCKIVLNFRGTCGAYANAPNNSSFGWAVRSTPNAASKEATHHCNTAGRRNDCKVQITACSEHY